MGTTETEQALREALAALRVLENRNRQLVSMLDALSDHLFLIDPEGRIVFLNAATAEVAGAVYGQSRDQVIGRSVFEADFPEHHRRHLAELIARVRAGERVHEEFQLPLPDGPIWHEQHLAPVHGADGSVEAIAFASREIQARKQAEARLHLLSKVGTLAGAAGVEDTLAQAASLAIPELADWSIFELVEDGLLQPGRVAHPDGERAAEAQAWLTRRPGGRRVDALGPAARILAIDEDASLRASDPTLHELLVRHGATSVIVLPFVVMEAPVAVATLVFGPESKRRHRPEDLRVAEEIARRAAQIVENARLRAQLEHALEYRERVMGILGHDLRNPVSAVMSISSSLAQRADASERIKQGLLHIHGSAERMEQMIGTILDFTRLRFREAPVLTRESFDVAALAHSIVDELRAAHPDRRITVDARGELRGHWDPTRLGQVISNLVGNALTHGARESAVDVELSSQGELMVLTVSNRGPTIPGDALRKLFEPFWQGPREDGGKARGLGLGLYIAEQVVHAHGGAIEVRSHEGQTTFTVRLPRG